MGVYADPMSETYYVIMGTMEEDFILMYQTNDDIPVVIAERRHLAVAHEMLRSVSVVVPGMRRAAAPDSAVETPQKPL